MFFLIGISDSLSIQSIVPANIFIPDYITEFAYYLKNIAYIHNIEYNDDNLKFTASPFRFIWNGWNLFNPISHGIFSISATGSVMTIEYSIFSIEFLVYSIIFSAIALSPLFPSIIVRITYLLIIWSLYIFHLFWVRHRLNKLLKLLASKVAEQYLDSLSKFDKPGSLG